MGLLDRLLHLAAETVLVKKKVSPEIAQERYAICLTCPYRDKEADKCTVCGCFLDLKTGAEVNWNALKSRNEETHCPLGKWNDLDIANAYRKIDGKQEITV